MRSTLNFFDLLGALKRNQASVRIATIDRDEIEYANSCCLLPLFFELIEQNTSMTNLKFCDPLYEEFIDSLIAVLGKNKTITALIYPKLTVSADKQRAIQRLLERNRKISLELPVNPAVCFAG